MTLTKLTRAAVAAFLLTAGPLVAEGFKLEDAYLRSSTPTSKTGAAFLMLTNDTGEDDRLIGASSDVATRVELHSHTQDTNGVMRMGEIEGGVPLAAGETHHFDRGGDHLMFTGLSAPLVQGERVPVTLEFEKAGKVEVEIPVDHERKPSHGG